MAAIKGWMLGTVAWFGLAAAAPGAVAGPATLREGGRPGGTTRVTISLTAKGLYRPEAPGAAGRPAEGVKGAEDSSKGLALNVETRLEFVERLLALDAEGNPSVALRRATRAGAAINGEVRPSSSALRPAVATLLAEVGPSGVEVSSLGGPLTRAELELVEGPGDPLALAGLLPRTPVAKGATWKVTELAAKSLSGYDTVASNGLEATLAALDDEAATVRLRGDVRGKVHGGEGSIAFNGSYTFDRKAGRIRRLTLERAEARRPGPVEAGLDVRSTLEVTREPAEPTASLSDAAVARLDLDRERNDPSRRLERRQLLLNAPDGRFSLRHDRDWHTYWDDHRVVVLKRLDRDGVTIGQCNLAAGPRAGKGRHQDIGQFRDDIRKGLGDRFRAFLGAGEVDGDPAGNFRYKIGVQGQQGDLGVVWYYYLIASPEGEQVLATFTLAAPSLRAFGAEDERLIATFRWEATPAEASGR